MAASKVQLKMGRKLSIYVHVHVTKNLSFSAADLLLRWGSPAVDLVSGHNEALHCQRRSTAEKLHYRGDI